MLGGERQTFLEWLRPDEIFPVHIQIADGFVTWATRTKIQVQWKSSLNSKTTKFPVTEVLGVSVIPLPAAEITLKTKNDGVLRAKMPLEQALELRRVLGFRDSDLLAFSIVEQFGKSEGPILAIVIVIVAAIVGLFAVGSDGLAPLLLLLPALVFFAHARAIGATLVIGHEGLLLRSLLGARLLKFTDVSKLTRSVGSVLSVGRAGVDVTLKDGSNLWIALVSQEDGETYESIFQALQVALSRFEERRRAPRLVSEETLLSLASPQERVRVVMEQRERQEGYRDAQLPIEDLREIVENATVDECARVTALALVKRSLSVDDRLRVRASFESSANPELRIAAAEILDAETEGGELGPVKRFGERAAWGPWRK